MKNYFFKNIVDEVIINVKIISLVFFEFVYKIIKFMKNKPFNLK